MLLFRSDGENNPIIILHLFLLLLIMAIATLEMPVATAVGMLRQAQNGWDMLTILDSIVTETPEPEDVSGYVSEDEFDYNDVPAVWDEDVNELMYTLENDYNDDVE